MRRHRPSYGAQSRDRGDELEPAAELRVVVRVERRDVLVEEKVDAAALEVALETGALVTPLICAADELEAPAARASYLVAEIGHGEELS